MTKGLAKCLLIAAVVLVLACEPPPAPKAEPLRIDAAQARKLVLAKYQALFAGKYYRVDAEYFEFPPLTEADFPNVIAKPDAWEVRCEPLAGPFVIGRVGKAGDWVDLDQVGYANL